MKPNWQTKKLGEVCKVIAGQSPEGKFYNKSGKGLPFYQGKKEFTEKFIGEPTTWTTETTKEAQADDILMSVRAPVGPVNFATQKICIGRGLAAIRPSKFIDKEFLFNFLQEHENEITGNTGAVFNSISKTQIENIKIPLPLLPEQHRIVKILDQAFAGISRAKENAENNLQNSREVFESYLQGVFAKPGRDWQTKKISDVCQIKPPKKEAHDKLNVNDLVSFVPMEDLGILTKYFVATKERKLKEVSGSYTYFSDNDVLLAKITPCFENGKIGVARNLKNGIGFGSSEYIVFRSVGKLAPDYLYYFLVRNQFRQEGKTVMTGAVGHKRVPKEFIENQKISYPQSLFDQQGIVAKLDALSAETKKLEATYRQKLADLEELKKSLLQKAFSGKLWHK